MPNLHIVTRPAPTWRVRMLDQRRVSAIARVMEQLEVRDMRRGVSCFGPTAARQRVNDATEIVDAALAIMKGQAHE